MDTSTNIKLKLTSQFQSFTALVDWLEIYDLLVASGLGYKRFYRLEFPKCVKNIMPEGYIPSFTTFRTHMQKIKKLGRQQYIARSRGQVNYKEWEKIYDEFISSGLSRNKFYEEMVTHLFHCSSKTFYKRIDCIAKRRSKLENLNEDNTPVKVVSIGEECFNNAVKTQTEAIQAKVSVSSKSNKTQITIKVGDKTSICFESLNPEYSVAKILASMERL